MINDIAKIYENIYNQELKNRETLDNKFSSRFTILLVLETAYVLVLTSIFDNLQKSQDYIPHLGVLFKVLCIVFIFTSVLSLISFYKCFFRFKKNYMVMPTCDIRIFHLYVYSQKLDGTKEEMDLFRYMVDSYQYCAFVNAKINSKREKYLILFDNIETVSFVLAIISYTFLRFNGIDINWIF